MSPSKSSMSDDELISLVDAAFEGQPIPPRPTAVELTCDAECPALPVAKHAGSWYRWLAYTPAIAVSVALAVALWRADSVDIRLQEKNVQTPERLDVVSRDPVAAQPPEPVVSQADETEDEIEVDGDQISSRREPPEKEKTEIAAAETEKRHDGLKPQAANVAAKERLTQVFAIEKVDATVIALDIRSRFGEKNVHVGVDRRSNTLLVSADAKSMDLVSQAIRNLDTPVALASLETRLEYLLRCVAKRKFDASAIEYFGENFEDKGALTRGLEKTGFPNAIKSGRRGLSNEFAWLDSQLGVSFMYRVDFPALMPTVREFVNEALRDEVFDAILQGVREDPEGPRIDIRRLVTFLRGDVMFIAEPHRGSQRMLTAMSLVEEEPIRVALTRMVLVEPDASKSMYRGVEIFEFAHADGMIDAACVANRCVIFGDTDMLKQRVDRIIK